MDGGVQFWFWALGWSTTPTLGGTIVTFDGGGEVVGDGLILADLAISGPLSINFAGIGDGLPIADLVRYSPILPRAGTIERGDLGGHECGRGDPHRTARIGILRFSLVTVPWASWVSIVIVRSESNPISS